MRYGLKEPPQKDVRYRTLLEDVAPILDDDAPWHHLDVSKYQDVVILAWTASVIKLLGHIPLFRGMLQGQVCILVKEGPDWRIDEILRNDSEAFGFWHSPIVAISPDGRQMAVSTYDPQSRKGAVHTFYRYTIAPGVYPPVDIQIVQPDDIQDVCFGMRIAFDASSRYLIIGGSDSMQRNNRVSRVWVGEWSEEKETWVYKGRIDASETDDLSVWFDQIAAEIPHLLPIRIAAKTNEVTIWDTAVVMLLGFIQVFSGLWRTRNR